MWHYPVEILIYTRTHNALAQFTSMAQKYKNGATLS